MLSNNVKIKMLFLVLACFCFGFLGCSSSKTLVSWKSKNSFLKELSIVQYSGIAHDSGKQFYDVKAEISGFILDKNGEPFKNLSFEIEGGDTSYLNIETDEMGFFYKQIEQIKYQLRFQNEYAKNKWEWKFIPFDLSFDLKEKKKMFEKGEKVSVINPYYIELKFKYNNKGKVIGIEGIEGKKYVVQNRNLTRTRLEMQSGKNFTINMDYLLNSDKIILERQELYSAENERIFKEETKLKMAAEEIISLAKGGRLNSANIEKYTLEELLAAEEENPSAFSGYLFWDSGVSITEIVPNEGFFVPGNFYENFFAPCNFVAYKNTKYLAKQTKLLSNGSLELASHMILKRSNRRKKAFFTAVYSRTNVQQVSEYVPVWDLIKLFPK